MTTVSLTNDDFLLFSQLGSNVSNDTILMYSLLNLLYWPKRKLTYCQFHDLCKPKKYKHRVLQHFFLPIVKDL